MKALDIVRTPKGGIAIVTEVGDRGDASITFLKGSNRTFEKNAWWGATEGLVIIDSIPRLLANAMAHPFGSSKQQGDRDFPV